MKNTNYLSFTLLIISFSFAISSCKNGEDENINAVTGADTELVDNLIERGEYLVGIMGCNDCHSPKKMGPNGPEIIHELLLSGYPSDRPVVKFDSTLITSGFPIFYPDLTAGAGPWGISFAGNLTPDETGIGNWTEAQFKIALTQGKFKGMENGRMLLPPMPWFNYVNLTDADVSAIFTYLKSVKPVRNIVPAPISPDKM